MRSIMKMSLKDLHDLVNRSCQDIRRLKSQLKEGVSLQQETPRGTLEITHCDCISIDSLTSPEGDLKSINFKLNEELRTLKEKYEILTNVKDSCKRNRKDSRVEDESNILINIRKDNMLVYKLLLLEMCYGNYTCLLYTSPSPRDS